MVSNADWNAVMSSEIFREYLKSESFKTAQPLPVEDSTGVVDAFLQFQEKVQANPKLLLAFRTLQNKFSSDAAYRSQVNPHFAEAVMLLDLDSDTSNMRQE